MNFFRGWSGTALGRAISAVTGIRDFEPEQKTLRDPDQFRGDCIVRVSNVYFTLQYTKRPGSKSDRGVFNPCYLRLAYFSDSLKFWHFFLFESRSERL